MPNGLGLRGVTPGSATAPRAELSLFGAASFTHQVRLFFRFPEGVLAGWELRGKAEKLIL